jgi:hypothetical protein
MGSCHKLFGLNSWNHSGPLKTTLEKKKPVNNSKFAYQTVLHYYMSWKKETFLKVKRCNFTAMGKEVGHTMIPSLTTTVTYKESYPGKALDKLNLSSRQVPNPGLHTKRFTQPTNQAIFM